MKTAMGLNEAYSALQVNQDSPNEHIFINFKSMVEQHVFPEGKDQKYIIAAKNAILIHRTHVQVRDRGFFVNGVPYEEPCSRCHGTGNLYKLIAEEIHNQHCDSCNGEKFVWIPCRKCNATGRFKTDDGNLRINVKCKACERFEKQWPNDKKFHYLVRCRDCRGLDTKVRYIGLESTTPCPVCKELGFFPKSIQNPVIIFGSIAQAIEKSEPQIEIKPDDRICWLHETNQEKINKMFDVK